MSLLVRSRLRQVRERAQAVTGLGGGGPGPATTQGPPGAGSNPPASKRVKLSSLVDPTAEAEFIPLSPTVLRDMFAKFEAERGGPPGVDVEPTLEQISAIKQLVDAGAPPYVDFALSGPHGRRFLKKLTCVETIFQVSSGTWVRRELPGPDNYEVWERSWAVFECAALLLGITSPEMLLAYQTRIRKYVTLYGPPAWPVIYQADVRMRSEHLERIQRRAEISQDLGLDAARPWNFVFAQAAADNTFWAEEVQERAVLLLARATPVARFLADGTLSEGPPSYAPRSDDRGTGGPVAGARPAPKSSGRGNRGITTGTKRPAKPPPKNPRPDRSGEVCNKYNSGQCQDPCPFGRRHVCSKRGNNHPAKSCTTGKAGGKGSR